MIPDLPSSNGLAIGALARSFNNVTNSYKFYWFRALLETIRLGKSSLVSIDDLLARMIVNAWYPINTFHLSFGKQDRLGKISIDLRHHYPHLTSDAKAADILQAISQCLASQSQLSQDIRDLGRYVPQRFLRPFFQAAVRGQEEWKVDAAITEIAGRGFSNTNAPSLYRFVGDRPHAIELNSAWLSYMNAHLQILEGFCLWHLVLYLQRNNQNVPNIAGKLFGPEQRHLRLATDYWRLALSKLPDARCIYSGAPILPSDFSIDHFLPWSFVAHDLLWNLVPTPKAVNSSKSDQLPHMTYLEGFAALQFQALQIVATSGHAKLTEDYSLLYSRYSLDELRSIAYPEFRQKLLDTIAPQYQIAQNMGFPRDWRYAP